MSDNWFPFRRYNQNWYLNHKSSKGYTDQSVFQAVLHIVSVCSERTRVYLSTDGTVQMPFPELLKKEVMPLAEYCELMWGFFITSGEPQQGQESETTFGLNVVCAPQPLHLIVTTSCTADSF